MVLHSAKSPSSLKVLPSHQYLLQVCHLVLWCGLCWSCIAPRLLLRRLSPVMLKCLKPQSSAPPWCKDPLALPRTSELQAPPGTIILPVPPGSLVPPAPHWSVVALPLPWTSTPPALLAPPFHWLCLCPHSCWLHLDRTSPWLHLSPKILLCHLVSRSIRLCLGPITPSPLSWKSLFCFV